MQEVDDDVPVTGLPDGEDEVLPPGPSQDLVSDIHGSGSSLRPAAQASKEPSPSSEEDAQKAALINQVLELQNTLDELSGRVNRVKEENAKLKSENEVLTQYIENLMASSTVIHTSSGNASGSSGTKKSIASSLFGFGGAKKS